MKVDLKTAKKQANIKAAIGARFYCRMYSTTSLVDSEKG